MSKILTRVPIASAWEAITKSGDLGKAAAAQPHEFLGFVTMNSKVHYLRYHIGEEEEDFVDVSVNEVDALNELQITAVYHCDGLVLCVGKDLDLSKLVVWNPLLCETRWIGPRVGENFNGKDSYAIGYDKKRDHKILRYVDDCSGVFRCEIYEMSSNSWRVLNVNPEWEIDEHQRGVSVKGNTYFFAHERYDDDGTTTDVEDFLVCFDFTKERFGPRKLPLPFHSYNEDCVTLSSFLRHDDEQLAVLFGGCESDKFEIWVTLTVEPDHVSWSKFLLVETGALFTALDFNLDSFFGGSFFVDEENKIAVVFELDSYISIMAPPPSQHMAFVFGQGGFFKSVSLKEALKLQYLSPSTGKHFETVCPPLVCSSPYRPSLVQVEQPLHKREGM